jgi:hypothetical protein
MLLYRTAAENISLAQIQSQIDVLNADFNALNSDFNSVPALFSGKLMEFHLYCKNVVRKINKNNIFSPTML